MNDNSKQIDTHFDSFFGVNTEKWRPQLELREESWRTERLNIGNRNCSFGGVSLGKCVDISLFLQLSLCVRHTLLCNHCTAPYGWDQKQQKKMAIKWNGKKCTLSRPHNSNKRDLHMSNSIFRFHSSMCRRHSHAFTSHVSVCGARAINFDRSAMAVACGVQWGGGEAPITLRCFHGLCCSTLSDSVIRIFNKWNEPFFSGPSAPVQPFEYHIHTYESERVDDSTSILWARDLCQSQIRAWASSSSYFGTETKAKMGETDIELTQQRERETQTHTE